MSALNSTYLSSATYELMHLRWNPDSDRVGEANLVRWDGHQALDQVQDSLGRHAALERTTKGDADRDRDRHTIRACPRHQAERGLQALFGRRVLVAPAELVGRGECVMHFVHPGSDRALVALLVQHQARIRGP